MSTLYNTFSNSSQMANYLNLVQPLFFPSLIVGNATPANKIFKTALPEFCFLYAEGQTAATQALDTSITWSAVTDWDLTNSTFGILLLKEAFEPLLPTGLYSTAGGNFQLGGVTGANTTASGISANGNFYMEFEVPFDLTLGTTLYFSPYCYLKGNV